MADTVNLAKERMWEVLQRLIASCRAQRSAVKPQSAAVGKRLHKRASVTADCCKRTAAHCGSVRHLQMFHAASHNHLMEHSLPDPVTLCLLIFALLSLPRLPRLSKGILGLPNLLCELDLDSPRTLRQLVRLYSATHDNRRKYIRTSAWSLEEAKANAFDKILPLVIFWNGYTPVRYVPAPATTCDGSRSTVGSSQLQSNTRLGLLMSSLVLTGDD